VSKVVLFLLVLPVTLLAQKNRYFVSFKDKANTIYSVSNPLQFISQKSIDRRAKENFILTEEDFPVNQNYIQQVKLTGAEVYFTSRWFNGVLVQTDASIAASIETLAFVTNVEFVAPGTKLTGGRAGLDKKFERIKSATTLQNQTQLQMIGLNKMHADGFHGEGIDIAIFDSGFNGADTITAFKPLYQEGRIKSTFNFVQNSSDVYSGYPHGTNVLSIMAAVSNVYLGGAYKANYFLYQTEDALSEYRIEEYNWLFAAEEADSAGVDVINSSLGYNEFDDVSMNYTYKDMDGKTSIVARAARKVFERGVVVVNAAGNEGDTSWRYIVTPADAREVLSCGAVNASLSRASISSVGPSSDNRIKPDVSAMGQGVEIIDDDGKIVAGTGTSYASPLVACLAAGLRQAFPGASANQIYDRIVSSSTQAAKPDNLLGYGIPDFEKALIIKDFVNDIEVYPNPVNDFMHIVFKSQETEPCNVTIFSSTGQKVAEYIVPVSWENDPSTIAVSPFAPGLYYLWINTSAGTRKEKIVILR
jgi:subtilisin family serine protease